MHPLFFLSFCFFSLIHWCFPHWFILFISGLVFLLQKSLMLTKSWNVFNSGRRTGKRKKKMAVLFIVLSGNCWQLFGPWSTLKLVVIVCSRQAGTSNICQKITFGWAGVIDTPTSNMPDCSCALPLLNEKGANAKGEKGRERERDKQRDMRRGRNGDTDFEFEFFWNWKGLRSILRGIKTIQRNKASQTSDVQRDCNVMNNH